MRPSTSRRLVDRFKPSLPERMKQSADAKSRSKLPEIRPSKPPKKQKEETKTYQTRIEVRSTAVTVTSNGQDPWFGWNSMLSTATTNIHTSIWRGWTTGGTTSGATITYDTWGAWQNPDYHVRGHYQRDQHTRVIVEESEEAKKARADREAQYKAVHEASLERRRKELEAENLALKRARELLLSCLTGEQKACLEKNRYFYVTAKSGRRYRIDEGTHGNVKVVDRDNQIIERLCIQPNGVPVGDSMLAQKLLIETSEDAFRKHANITLKDGRVLMGDPTLLDVEKMGQVIPFRRVA